MKPRVVAEMNQMMQAVVTEGTGRRAQLDITHTVGKTGTSSSYRDAWFVGFTGQLVTGVWIGNDDFRPMIIDSSARTGSATGVTGGGLPAQTWQAYMTVAHTTPNIPTIAGLTPHPRLVQEQQRLAELKRLDPQSASSNSPTLTRRNPNGISDQTMSALRRVTDTLRRAGGNDVPTPAQAPRQAPPPPAPDTRRQSNAPIPTPPPAPSPGPRADARPAAGAPAANVR